MKIPDPMDKPELFYALVARRKAKGLPALPDQPDRRVAEDRYIEMLRLRLCDGLTLREIGEQTGVGSERVRQVLAFYFEVRGRPRTAKPRRRR